jgi:general stress protein YciG
MNALANSPLAAIHPAASEPIPPECPNLLAPIVRQRRGFSVLSPERRREIASLGGRTAHAQGTAHQFTSQEARAAGRKGGATVSQDRAHMAHIGRLGGHQRSNVESGRT